MAQGDIILPGKNTGAIKPVKPGNRYFATGDAPKPQFTKLAEPQVSSKAKIKGTYD